MSSEIKILIFNVSFPIASSIYLLIIIEARLQLIGGSIDELIKNINVMKVK